MPVNESNEARGRRGEEFACDQFGLERRPDIQWYDAVNPRTGAKYEVKTALPDRMFRFWRDQHHSLSGANGRGTGWYVLIIMDDNGDIKRWRRVKPQTVARVIRERGGFNKQTHRRDQQQKKVPTTEFFE